MRDNNEQLHFDIHPSVVFKLGEDLVTDDIPALIELIKNSYDADATYVKVEVNTNGVAADAIADSEYPDAKGYILITDDGKGMDINDIRDGWLVISNSLKKNEKEQDIRTDKGRLPLGDKGLGRLGSQLLGKNIEVFTVSEGSNETEHVSFSWGDFIGTELLSKVQVQHKVRKPTNEKKGTKLLISGLINLERWSEPSIKGELETKFIELISPFEGIENFAIMIEVNGVLLDLLGLTKQIRNGADLTFSFKFDGGIMKVKGRAKLRYLNPGRDKRRRNAFEWLCEPDGGMALLEYLQVKDTGKRSINKSISMNWFLEFERSFIFKDTDRVLRYSEDKIADPGPFYGEIDSFSLDISPIDEDGPFSSKNEYKSYIKSRAGIYIYRDSFGVREDRNFLRLGQYQTGGKSWYSLRDHNTIGYISISVKKNRMLVEKSDREGFKDTAYYRNFIVLLGKVIKLANEDMTFLRRTTNDFCDEYLEEAAGVEPGLSPEALSVQIGAELGKVTGRRDEIGEAAKKLKEEIKVINESAKHISEMVIVSDTEKKIFEKNLASIEKSHQILEEVETELRVIDNFRDRYDVLQTHIESFNERLAQTYETVSLGITAEVFAHEILNVIDGIGERIKDIELYIKKNEISDKKVNAFIRHIRTANRALRKQLSRLDPSLKYAREQRDNIDLFSFFEDLRKYHNDRWLDIDISIELLNSDKGEFKVSINRGKLTQIFDNLVLNSEYWLKEDLRLDRINSGIITINSRPPYVWVSDNGRGIDQSVEESLFEPFVSMKNEGRGLGLFIVREFLGSEGCEISILSERNKVDRLFVFELDLSGMVYDGK